MDYSAIILTFNSERFIENCLKQLVFSFNETKKSYEIYVIDNGSSDKTLSIIENTKKEISGNIIIIPFDYNTGTTYSRNQGLKRAIGNRIIIMDSDAYVTPEVIHGLGDYLDNHPECGLVVPKLIYPDGRFQISTDVFPTLRHKIIRFFFLKKMEEKDNQEQLAETSVDYAISAFWMLPKEVINQVGYLDEKIFYSPEDVDYCIRVWLAGKKISYLSQYSMIHDAQEISRAKGLKINKFTLSHLKGLIYLFVKHKYFFSLNRLYKRINNTKVIQ